MAKKARKAPVKKKLYQEEIAKINAWVNSGLPDHEIMSRILESDDLIKAFHYHNPKEPIFYWPEIVEYTTVLRKSPKKEDQVYSIYKLGESRSKLSVPALEEAVMFHEDPNARALAVDALEKISGARANRILETALLRESDKKVKLALIRALGKNGDEGSGRVLEQIVQSETEEPVKTEAKKAVSKTKKAPQKPKTTKKSGKRGSSKKK